MFGVQLHHVGLKPGMHVSMHYHTTSCTSGCAALSMPASKEVHTVAESHLQL
jgi:hypothetical protein